MKAERGKFLTIMIVLGALGLLQALYYYMNTDMVQQTLGVVPSWYPMYLLVGVAVQAAGLYGLWIWKKWGAYAIFAWIAITLAAQLTVIKPVQYGEFAYISTALMGGLWFWAIHRKWKYFV